jgi:hypothetical protein
LRVGFFSFEFGGGHTSHTPLPLSCCTTLLVTPTVTPHQQIQQHFGTRSIFIHRLSQPPPEISVATVPGGHIQRPESGSLSVYFLYTSSLKPERLIIGSPKKLIQLQRPKGHPHVVVRPLAAGSGRSRKPHQYFFAGLHERAILPEATGRCKTLD